MASTSSDSNRLSRRTLLGSATATALAATAAAHLAPSAAHAADVAAPSKDPFTYCLNTSTIRGQKLTLPQEIDLAAKAGYTAMEPWLREIEDFVKAGGDTKDLKKRCADSGIAVVDIIGFAPWLMGDDEANKKNMETMKRDMDLSAQIGAQHIAAPPAGAFKLENFDLKMAGRRYRQVLELGEQSGVMPMLEFWGSSKTLSTLSEALFITSAAKHPKATILCDIYHLHRGGSGYDGLALVAGSALPVLHMNDFPADPPREKLEDKHRLMPGDGIAPFGQILKTLVANGARTALSLELFNNDYWKMDAAEVLKMGIEKMKTTVAKALA